MKSARPLVIASVMTSMVMIAIEATIVSTAMPQIVAELGGLRFYSWVFSADVATLAAVAALFSAATVAFVLVERHAAQPMVSFALWSHRPIAATNAVGLLAGMALTGLTTFLPMYVQIVLQRSPVVAGLALTTMLVGWAAGATLAAQLFQRITLRRLLLLGAILLPVGAVCFVILTPASSPILAGAGSLVMGVGMGFISVSSLVLLQEIVDATQRGSVTASNIFSRNLGIALGATVLGAVLNHGLAHGRGGESLTSEQLRRLHESPVAGQVGDAALRLVLQRSLNLTFWSMLAMSLAAAIVALLIPAVAMRGDMKSVDPAARVGRIEGSAGSGAPRAS